MAIITTIEDANGKQVYPNTVSNAVYHDKKPMSDILGDTDISGIGDGTLTGAMKDINDKFKDNDVSQKIDSSDYEKDMGTTSISGIGDGTVTGAIDKLNTEVNGKIDKITYTATIGKTNLSSYGDGTVTGAIDTIGKKVDGKVDKTTYNKEIGSTSISTIGDGTVTGAISKINNTMAKTSDITTINTNLSKKLDKSVYDSNMGTTSISGIGDGTVKGAIKYLKDNGGGSSSSSSYVTTSTYNSDMGTTSISGIGNGTVKGAIKNIDTNLDSLSDRIGTVNISSIGSTITGAIKSLFQSVSDGKKVVANAITAKGVTTSSSATFATMATNIKNIKTSSPITLTGTGDIMITPSNTSSRNSGSTNFIIKKLPKGTVFKITDMYWYGVSVSGKDLLNIMGFTPTGTTNYGGYYDMYKIYYPNTMPSSNSIVTRFEGDSIYIQMVKFSALSSSEPNSDSSPGVAIVHFTYTLTLPS